MYLFSFETSLLQKYSFSYILIESSSYKEINIVQKWPRPPNPIDLNISRFILSQEHNLTCINFVHLKKVIEKERQFPQSILKLKHVNVVCYILMVIRNLSCFNGYNYFHAIILVSNTKLFRKFVILSKYTLINVQKHMKLD